MDLTLILTRKNLNKSGGRACGRANAYGLGRQAASKSRDGSVVIKP